MEQFRAVTQWCTEYEFHGSRLPRRILHGIIIIVREGFWPDVASKEDIMIRLLLSMGASHRSCEVFDGAVSLLPLCPGKTSVASISDPGTSQTS